MERCLFDFYCYYIVFILFFLWYPLTSKVLISCTFVIIFLLSLVVIGISRLYTDQFANNSFSFLQSPPCLRVHCGGRSSFHLSARVWDRCQMVAQVRQQPESPLRSSSCYAHRESNDLMPAAVLLT